MVVATKLFVQNNSKKLGIFHDYKKINPKIQNSNINLYLGYWSTTLILLSEEMGVVSGDAARKNNDSVIFRKRNIYTVIGIIEI